MCGICSPTRSTPRRRGSWPIAWTFARASVTLHRDSRKAEDLTGDVLTFPTREGEIVVAVLPGIDAVKREDTVASHGEPYDASIKQDVFHPGARRGALSFEPVLRPG